MLRALPLVILSACTLSAGGNHRLVGAVEKPIADAASLTRLEVSNVAGVIEVHTADQTGARVEVEVFLTENRPETDFEADFAKHVEMVNEAGRLSISNRHGSENDSNDWQLRFKIFVPAGIALSLEQAAGSVGVQLPKAGDISVNNTAGTVNVTVPEVDGQVAIEIATGQAVVKIADRGPTGGCDISCAAGQITLELPKDIGGQFNLGSTTGSIDCAGRYGLSVKRTMTSVSAAGTVGQGGPDFRAQVVTGTIDLR